MVGAVLMCMGMGGCQCIVVCARKAFWAERIDHALDAKTSQNCSHWKIKIGFEPQGSGAYLGLYLLRQSY